MPGCRRRKILRKRVQPLRRRDMAVRMVVDIGIHYSSVLGLEQASAFLRQQQVPEAVILRVFQAKELHRRA